MAVQTDIARAWLRRQKALVPGTYATLLAALEAEAFATIDIVKRGSIASTSAGDRSTSFSSSGDSQGDFAELGADMLDLYEASKAALIAGGIPTPNDTQIFTEMLDRLQPVIGFQTNYTGLRVA